MQEIQGTLSSLKKKSKSITIISTESKGKEVIFKMTETEKQIIPKLKKIEARGE